MFGDRYINTNIINTNLNGKRALVTGGSHGIGLEIAKILALAGADIVICSRSKARLMAAANEIAKSEVDVLALECDVLSKESIHNVWKEIETKCGGVDIVINNVGGGGRWGEHSPLSTSLETWDEVIQMNSGSSILFTMLALPGMLQANWGRVICVTSIYGSIIGGRPWFNMAKVAQNVLMKNLAQNKEFTRKGVTFNSVAPGAIMIPETGWDTMQRNQPEEFMDYVENLPLGRLGKPEEIASLVLFLCSTNSGYINGASITIDGGESHSPY